MTWVSLLLLADFACAAGLWIACRLVQGGRP